VDSADDNTPQFYSSRQNALPRSPTPSDDSPQPILVSRSGNRNIMSKSTDLSQNKGESMDQSSHLATNPGTLHKVPSYAEFTSSRIARSSGDSLGAMGAYPDAASNQPSRTTDPRLTDHPPTADPVAASTRRERTSKSKKEMSQSRSGQVSPHFRVVLVFGPHQELILHSSPLLVQTMYTVSPHHLSPPSHRARSLRRTFLRHRRTYHSRERHKQLVLIPQGPSGPKNMGKGVDRLPRRTQRAKEIRSNPSPR
jgi:hypothetical protein